MSAKRILVFGASGLIGQFVAADLERRGHRVVAVARRFSPAQRARFSADGRELPIAALGSSEIADLLRASNAEVVVNCLGVLQDEPGSRMCDVHGRFVDRLIAALRDVGSGILLVHVSVPGAEADDRTAFSLTKRKAERQIVEAYPHAVVLRPGFVFAPAAYGGSALLRALAASPFELPRVERERPFAYVAVEDLAETVARAAETWAPGKPDGARIWDVMHPHPCRVGDVVDALRGWLGISARAHAAVPGFLLAAIARMGDLAGWLGWRPPIRSTALAEMRRGVAGNPAEWRAATGIEPMSLEAVLRSRPATVQDKWFAALYGLKPLVIAVLAAFWSVSGAIALAAFAPAAAILTAHGWSDQMARIATITSSLMDLAVGLAIAVRPTCRAGLITGIAVSVFYMMGAAVLTPDLWGEPLGALVKTGPAIVLMLVALATLEAR